MKSFGLLLVLFSAVAGASDLKSITLLCHREESRFCNVRAFMALSLLGCNPKEESVKCMDAVTDPLLDPEYIEKMKGYDFCRVLSECREPHYGSFGDVSCSPDQSLDLKNTKQDVTLTTEVGLFHRFVTKVCR